MPHPFEHDLKLIFAAKDFDPGAYVSSSLNDFFAHLLDFFNEFCKPQETGIFKKTKQIEYDRVLQAMNKLIPLVTRSNISAESLDKIDSIFCFFFHPDSPGDLRSQALSKYLAIIGLLSCEDLTHFCNSLSYAVPFVLLSRDEEEKKGFSKAILPDSKPLFFMETTEIKQADASAQLSYILDFILLNWSTKTEALSKYFLEDILSVIYMPLASSSGVASKPYGFHLPLIPELHSAVMGFLSGMSEKKLDVTALFNSSEKAKFITAIMKESVNVKGLTLPTVKFLGYVCTNKELCKQIPLDIFSSLSGVVAQILSADTSAGIFEEASSFFQSFLEVQKSDTKSFISLIERTIDNARESPAASILTLGCILRYLFITSERSPEIWMSLRQKAQNSKSLSACAAKFAQYLAVLSYKTVFEFDQSEITDICLDYFSRGQRNKVSNPHDFVCQNIQSILAQPNEFVRSKLPIEWEGLAEMDQILSTLPVQPLSVSDLPALTENFLEIFDSYADFEAEDSQRNAFAVIYCYYSALRKLSVLPPGVKVNRCNLVNAAHKRLLHAILDQKDQYIQSMSFSLLASIINKAELNGHLSDILLSQWFYSEMLMMLRSSKKAQVEALDEAIRTVEIGMAGSSFLIPIILTAIEKNELPPDPSIVSFLSSQPLFVSKLQNPEAFYKSMEARISMRATNFCDDFKSILNASNTKLRERALSISRKYFLTVLRAQNTEEKIEWGVVLPLFTTILIHEATSAKCDAKIIDDFLRIMADVLKQKGPECVNAINSIIEYAPIFISAASSAFHHLLKTMCDLVTTINLADNPQWVFDLITMTTSSFIHGFSKDNDLIDGFANWLSEFPRRKDIPSEYPQRITRLCNNCLILLSVYYGSYPFTHSPLFASNKTQFAGKTLDLIVGNENIIGTKVEAGKTTVASITPVGQFVWNFKPMMAELLEDKEAEPFDVPFSIATQKIASLSELQSQNDLSTTIENVISSYEQNYNEVYKLDAIEDSEVEETASLVMQAFINVPQAQTKPPVSLRPVLNIENLAAATLTATGHVDVELPEMTKKLLISPQSELFIQKARDLNSRYKAKVAVVYAANNAENQSQILKTKLEETSPHFKEFLCGLGWPINLSTHSGYSGGLDLARSGNSSVFYADLDKEVMFHVAPLLPTDPNDDQQVSKKKHIGNDHVHIVFCDSQKDFDVSTITSQFGMIHIVVYPRSDGLFRVDSHWRSGISWFGPLHGAAIVTKRALPSIVRATAMAAMVNQWQKQDQFSHPTIELNDHIQKLAACAESISDSEPIEQLMVLREKQQKEEETQIPNDKVK